MTCVLFVLCVYAVKQTVHIMLGCNNRDVPSLRIVAVIRDNSVG